MGKYLNSLPTGHLPIKGKAEALLALENVTLLNEAPSSVDDIPENRKIVCIVDNGMFEAAALMYNQPELEHFKGQSNPKKWIQVPDYVAECAV